MFQTIRLDSVSDEPAQMLTSQFDFLNVKEYRKTDLWTRIK